MRALFLKEIRSFFTSIIGIVVISVFLLTMGLFVWLLPSQFNVIQNGYASLESVFYIAPWVLLLLIPAVTMRLFAEEKRLGTLETLLTKPINDFQIVLAKYLAALVIVVVALLPILVYYVSVQYFLSDRAMDTGGFWGSFIGLLFLASVYVAIGLFSSSLTSGQIVAFIVAVFLTMLFYIGFDLLSEMNFWGGFAQVCSYLSLDNHYASMSRGVLDSRDIVYFLSLDFIFIYLTSFVLKTRKW